MSQESTPTNQKPKTYSGIEFLEPDDLQALQEEQKSQGKKIQFQTSESGEHAPDPLLDIEKEKRRPLDLPKPRVTLSYEEKDILHKELLEDAESQIYQIHDDLTFWAQEEINERDIQEYTKEEAIKIIEESNLFNKEQKEAVLASTDDLIINALAGTGKTRSISGCIAYLLAIGTLPYKIGVSSHTVSAAEEISGRVEPTTQTLFPKYYQKERTGYDWRLQAGTIHAIAYRELNKYRHPRSKNSILEEYNQVRIWKEACQFTLARDYSPKEDGVYMEWMKLHERARGMAISEERVPKILESITQSSTLSEIAATYYKIKEARDLLDYTDLLRLWAPLIIHPAYKGRWKYFFVDEYQDTNPLQKFLLKLLRVTGTKVIVCGDIRQSITNFTGSDPSAEDPQKILPGPTPAKKLWLQVNYRCSKEVLSLANGILQNMLPTETHRLTPWEGAQDGELIKLFPFVTNKDEELENRTTIASAVETLEKLQKERKENEPHPSVAILYRSNSQGSRLEETIASINSKYIKNGEKTISYVRKDYRKTALKTKTEKEINAILYAWQHPDHAHWFEILTSPYFPGIGEVTANTIESKAKRIKPQTIEEIWEVFDGEISRKGIEIVGSFLETWENVSKKVEKKNLEKLTAKLAAQELRNWIRSQFIEGPHQKTAKSSSSKREIEENQRRSHEAAFLDKIESYEDTLVDNALRKIEIEEEQEKDNEAPKGILLSTIHLAKGREYDGVVLHNVSWFTLPHFHAIKQEEEPESILERRWRKLCAIEADRCQSKSQLQEITQNPEKYLPKVFDYPKKLLWGKTRDQTEREGDMEAFKTNRDGTAWDWITNPIEEEKRILYVAVTRARKYLTITTRGNGKSHPFIRPTQWWKLLDGESLLEE